MDMCPRDAFTASMGDLEKGAFAPNPRFIDRVLSYHKRLASNLGRAHGTVPGKPGGTLGRHRIRHPPATTSLGYVTLVGLLPPHSPLFRHLDRLVTITLGAVFDKIFAVCTLPGERSCHAFGSQAPAHARLH